jgi:hypothetical protein
MYPFDVELIVTYEAEKINYCSLEKPLNEFLELKDGIKVDFKLIVKTIQDERRSKLVQ